MQHDVITSNDLKAKMIHKVGKKVKKKRSIGIFLLCQEISVIRKGKKNKILLENINVTGRIQSTKAIQKQNCNEVQKIQEANQQTKLWVQYHVAKNSEELVYTTIQACVELSAINCRSIFYFCIR